MLYTPISQFRQHLLEITENEENKSGVVVVRNSKPIGVYLPFETWQKNQTLTDGKKIDVRNFFIKTKKKLRPVNKGKVLSQKEIDRLSYVS